MSEIHTLWVENGLGRIAIERWGELDPKKPPAFLVHGTSFAAGVWDEIASALASRYVVYAIDRRGHGASHKAAIDQYHFLDFASDLSEAIEALDLCDIVGLGHSAGATDLLISAGRLPQRFSRLFVMEPTVMDPSRRRAGEELSDEFETALKRVRARRLEFDSAAEALRRFRAAPAFAKWSERALRAYVQHGFAALPHGRVRLLCTPEIEAAMLRPIFEAMAQIYDGDERGDPFSLLSEIKYPVCVSTAEHSEPIYKEMAARAVTLISHANQWRFADAGHCVAQESPTLLLAALEEFEAATA